jgi:5S rRNA maturation endonuclease (ribonuclease M5)
MHILQQHPSTNRPPPGPGRSHVPVHDMRQQMGPMTDRDDVLREFLESLAESTVIVEGRKDAEALEALGVDGRQIVVLNKGQSLLDTVEALSGEKDVAILTDMDGEGKRLRHRLLKLFGQYGVQENVRPRELFSQLRLSHVEGL